MQLSFKCVKDGNCFKNILLESSIMLEDILSALLNELMLTWEMNNMNNFGYS